MGLRRRGNVWILRKQVKGKRVEISTGHTDLQFARKRAAQLTNMMLNEEQGLVEKNVPTFGAWWETYEANYVGEKAETTQKRDRGIIKPWLVMWRTERLDRIKKTDCLAALRERRLAKASNPGRLNPETISEATVQRERRLIQALFERAVEDGHIEKNPWKGIEGVKDDVRVRLLTPEGEKALLTALETPGGNAGNVARAKARVYQRFITFVLETGTRLDEVLGIDPEKDIHDGYVTVLGKGGKYRDVPLTRKAKAALDEQLKEEGRLWTVTPQRIREVIENAAEKAKIGPLSPHDLRHTFGHRYLQRGGRIHTLSKILGHASIVVTEKHYAHLLKEDIAAEMLAVMES